MCSREFRRCKVGVSSNGRICIENAFQHENALAQRCAFGDDCRDRAIRFVVPDVHSGERARLARSSSAHCGFCCSEGALFDSKDVQLALKMREAAAAGGVVIPRHWANV